MRVRALHSLLIRHAHHRHSNLPVIKKKYINVIIRIIITLIVLNLRVVKTLDVDRPYSLEVLV